jgi:hypothetical protein
LLVSVLIAVLIARRLPYVAWQWLFNLAGITARQNRLQRGVFAFLQATQRAQTTSRRTAGARSPPNKAPSALTYFGLDERATFAELEAAYRKQALATHPDHGGSDEQFKDTQRQYELARAWIIETTTAKRGPGQSQRR